MEMASQVLEHRVGSENQACIADFSMTQMVDGRTRSLPGLSKFGLLYTDAAHSVLQDLEVADFLTRSKSTKA